jgi:hypothetical protein
MSLYDRIASAAILSGQYDDGLTTRYDVALGVSPNHVQHTGTVVRTGIRFESGSAGIGTKVQSVLVRFRKFGSPTTGNITINVRKASDDSAVLIGTFPIEALGVTSGVEHEFVVRNRFNQTYAMVANDIVSIEYPAGASGSEISTNAVASDPSGYTSRSYNGSVWSSALADPISCVIKGA